MLLISHPAPNAQLMGFGAANAAVQSLQNSLKALAQVSGRTAIDPGTADGYVGIRTMSAITAAFGIISDKLPREVSYALQVGLVVGGATNQAMSLVTQYASQLDMAVKAATLRLASGGGATPQFPTTNLPTPATPQVPMPSPTPTKSFFMTPFGMASIAVGAVGLTLLVVAAVR